MAPVFIYGVCIILLSAPIASPKRICSPQNVLDYLNLTRNNEKFTASRPVLDWTHPTEVYLDVFLCAILSVTWSNELISWNPEDFCGISKVSLPREMLWKPDLSIFELAEKENGPPSPYLSVTYEGEVTMEEGVRTVCICKMDVHKFPFDTQSCQITISSIIYSSDELKLFAASNSTKTTQQSREFMITQGEWELMGMNVTMDSVYYSERATWDLIKYTISIRRMPLLHVLNFQLPVLFFLILDLASFFIPDSKGEKLSFKVTVLLAMSVLLLILKDILPSTSDRSPLIAIYLTFTFTLMLLSLLETILVAYLTELDPSSEVRVSESVVKSSLCNLKPEELFTPQNGGISDKDERERLGSDVCVSSGVNSPSGSVMELDGVGEQEADVHLLHLILEQLQSLRQSLPALTVETGTRGGHWSRVAKRINAVFYLFYSCSIFLFLIIISLKWR
ncbi:5-hydroxytryptamine receptor 3A-like [Hoplias malabaricus]|uniref:5-hydroxytryptamine receptor 3A-like n=1 Tax=Hoplias malabaricus TaxID=27720 RepID=UPI0034618823